MWSKDHRRTAQGAVWAEVFPEELSSLYPQRIEEIITLEDTRELPLERTRILLSRGLKKNKN